MDGLETVLSNQYPLVALAALFVMGYVRLEAKVFYLEKDHLNHIQLTARDREMLWAKIDDIRDTNTQIIQTLAKIEGRLESMSSDK